MKIGAVQQLMLSSINVTQCLRSYQIMQYNKIQYNLITCHTLQIKHFEGTEVKTYNAIYLQFRSITVTVVKKCRKKVSAVQQLMLSL